MPPVQQYLWAHRHQQTSIKDIKGRLNAIPGVYICNEEGALRAIKGTALAYKSEPESACALTFSQYCLQLKNRQEVESVCQQCRSRRANIRWFGVFTRKHHQYHPDHIFDQDETPLTSSNACSSSPKTKLCRCNMYAVRSNNLLLPDRKHTLKVREVQNSILIATLDDPG